jgi:DNA-directed RNA polymerase specialized sigma24 family protein
MNTRMTAATADVRRDFAEKVERKIFAPVARHLREDLVEDRLAEGIAMAFQQYVTSVANGRPMPDALLVRACHVRAIDIGRRLGGADGARPKQDVYDERAFKAGHVELLRLDRLVEDGGEAHGSLGWAEVDGSNPARTLASAVDLERWLAGLGPEDRMMLALRQAGHTLGGIGAATGRSTSVVFKRLRELGEELAEVAGIGATPGQRREPAGPHRDHVE